MSTQNSPKRSLRRVLTWTITVCCFLGVVASGLLFTVTMYNQDKKNSFALFSLQLDHQVRAFLGYIIDSIAAKKKLALIHGKEADVLFKWNGQAFEAEYPAGFGSQSKEFFLGNTLAKRASRHFVIIDGKPYVAKYSVSGVEAASGSDTLKVYDRDYVVKLWSVDLAGWLQEAKNMVQFGDFYLLTGTGDIVFSTLPIRNSQAYLERDLVKSFLGSPVQKGQIDLGDSYISRKLGYFIRIPHTNLVFFYEASSFGVFKDVYTKSLKNLAIGLILVFIAILIVQFPLGSTLKPIQYLTEVSNEVAKGNYSKGVKTGFVGEIDTLARAMDNLCTSLVERDRRIEIHVEEQKAFARKERELEFAGEIQKSFIGPNSRKIQGKVDFCAKYIPASEVAGDWYDFYCDEKNGECVALLADVMGHGVASAMYTAIIASIYRKHLITYKGNFSLKRWFDEVNQILYNLDGHYATAVGLHYRFGNDFVSMCSAGHLHPVKISKNKDVLRAKTFRVKPGDPFGFSGESIYEEERVMIEKGDCILLYSDGIVEAVGKNSKEYGRKRMLKNLSTVRRPNPRQFLDVLTQSLADFEQKDDVCLLACQFIDIEKKS